MSTSAPEPAPSPVAPLPAPPVPVARREELAGNLTEVRGRITRACRRAGRDPGEVTLVAVTKTWPASDVRLLAELGVREVGESRDQEAREKAAACLHLDLRWHFVGRLQTNKARSVAGYADVVQSVDRAGLVAALSAGAQATGRLLHCLIQVNLDPESESEAQFAASRTRHRGPQPGGAAAGPARGGAAVAEVPVLAAAIEAAGGLRLAGVMAVAPHPQRAGQGREEGPDGGREEGPEEAFAHLAEVSVLLRRRYPHASVVSAGMSGDLEQAIAAGATSVRVGSALLGARSPTRSPTRSSTQAPTR